MPPNSLFPLQGGCDCRQLRYRLNEAPLFVHCCHCRWCQRESGAAFALNAMLESNQLQCLCGTPEMIDTPSASGRGQQIARCPTCRVALWSHYSSAGPLLAFVRVGTLDTPDALPPDIHIFTASKQPWLQLPDDVPAVPEYYERSVHWPAASLQRWQALQAQIEAFRVGFNGAPASPARGVVLLPPGDGRHYAMGRIAAVFKADLAETDNRYSISEWWLEPFTRGPGAHAHDEDDVFFVLHGTMSFLAGDSWIDARTGSFVLVPGGTTHDFENRGGERAGVLNLSVPGGFETHMPDIVDWFIAHPPADTRDS
jgi:mannose-6-phosphate isomerase-like protein (cupin superfamily)